MSGIDMNGSLQRFARVSLAHLPTPLEFLPKLSTHLGGPCIYIKRDDCTGLATGGNKTRQLEFLLGEALASGADTIVTQGATQSNHVRQTAAAAAKLGLRCEVILEQRVTSFGEDYAASGNVLLDRLFGAEIVDTVPAGSDMPAALASLAHKLAAQGRKPYVIPGGGANAVGALGYVACALEIVEQCAARALALDGVIVASSSGGTQAGLIAGLALAGAKIAVTGISVSARKGAQETLVHRLAQQNFALFEPGATLLRDLVHVDDAHIGEGYGRPARETIAAVNLLARLEGLLLDPVYTGPAMAGLIALIREQRFGPDQNVLFLHTGGAPTLFSYRSLLQGG